MKKRLLSILLLAGLTCGLAKASGIITSTSYVNEPALAYNKTFTVDLNDPKGDHTGPADTISFQAVCSSTTPSAQTFTDGLPSTGSITVSALTHLSSASATDQVTVADMATLIPTAAHDSLTVVSTSGLTGLEIKFNRIRLTNGTNFTSVNTTTGTAEAIKVALNALPGLAASRSGAVVYATATAVGVQGNAYTLSSSTPSAVSIASANFTGGQNHQLFNATLTIGRHVLHANREWRITSTSSGTAVNIAAAITLLSEFDATADTNTSVIYATVTARGAAGNAYGFTASTAALTVSSAAFTGGRDAGTVNVNGIPLVNGTDWTAGGTNALTAKAISDAIMANSRLSAVLSSTWTVQGVVYATSTTVGTNAFPLSTNTADLVASAPAFQGGTATQYAPGRGDITIPAHGFSLALPVLFSTNSAVSVSPLVNQTTYYMIPTDANTVYVASTSALAVTGHYLVLTSSTSGGPHTWTFRPLTYSGTPSMKWEASNDDVNFNDVAVSSYTYSTPSSTPVSTVWDFGTVNYRFLRLNVKGPTAGGLHLQVTGNYKKVQ